MLIRFRLAGWRTLVYDLVIQPGLIAAIFVGAIWAMSYGEPTNPNDDWFELFLAFWAAFAGLILLLSIPVLVPAAWRAWKDRRKE